MGRRSRLRPVGDMAAAGWVVEGVGAFGSGVGGLVPHGFEAYARILHPAAGADATPVTWAEVAAWAGRRVHPRAQFQALSAPARDKGIASPRHDRPWLDEPEPGTLPPAQLAALCDVLARHTTSGDHCWFCVWDGYGTAGDDRRTATFVSTEGDGRPPAEPELLPPDYLPDAPRVELPKRTYLLFEGPLDAAGETAISPLLPQSPNLFWPADRTWCVATDTDLDSTYFGGTAALVAEVLADGRLEAVPVEVGDPVWADSDEINR